MVMNVRESKLANGVRVITSTRADVESVSFGIWVGVGGRFESKANAGISHFIEHLLFKGTKKRSARKISEAIEGCGGYLNAFTQEESTCFYARVPYNRIWRAVDVLSDMYLNSRLDATEILKERNVIIEEIMMYRDQPQHMVHEMLSEALWKDHPLGTPIIGSPESLAGITKKNLTDFLKNNYIPGDTVFAFAGKLEHDQCVKKVTQIVGRMRKKPLPKWKKVADSVKQQRVVIASKDIEQSHMALGFRLFGRKDERRYALRILNTVLGENMSSRLFQVVREQHGLAYSVHSSCHLFKDSGALVITAGLDKTKTYKALDLIVRELKKMKDKAIGVGELRNAKDYVIGQTLLSLESTSNQMICLGDNMITHGRFLTPEEAVEAVSKVTSADVQKLARLILRGSKASISVIAPRLSAKDESSLGRVVRKI